MEYYADIKEKGVRWYCDYLERCSTADWYMKQAHCRPLDVVQSYCGNKIPCERVCVCAVPKYIGFGNGKNNHSNPLLPFPTA